VLVDARGERLTPSHAVKNCRRDRYYVSGTLNRQAGADRAQGWRLPAEEIEDAGGRRDLPEWWNGGQSQKALSF
jgi:hypothetical protein